jgi:DNA-binding transcriptional ArsR family regulator
MKKYQTQTQTFKALMHPTRLAILDMLRDGEQCVCHMEAVFGLRQAHISQHLMVLRDAGLVTDRRDGWNIFYRVTTPEIYQVIDAMNAFSGDPGENPFAAEIKKQKQACPCPKCNAGEPSSSTEIAAFSSDVIRTKG